MKRKYEKVSFEIRLYNSIDCVLSSINDSYIELDEIDFDNLGLGV